MSGGGVGRKLSRIVLGICAISLVTGSLIWAERSPGPPVVVSAAATARRAPQTPGRRPAPQVSVPGPTTTAAPDRDGDPIAAAQDLASAFTAQAQAAQAQAPAAQAGGAARAAAPPAICAVLLTIRAQVVVQFANLIARFPARAAQLTAIRNAVLAVIDAISLRFGCRGPSNAPPPPPKRPSKTVVTSAPATPGLCDEITFTATVSPADGGAGVPSGTVEFFADGASLGPAVALAGGVATLKNSTVSQKIGDHPIEAKYSGDATFDPSSGMLTQAIKNTFPTVADIQADATVEAAIKAAFDAGKTDFKERAAWIRWNCKTKKFSLTEVKVGTQDSSSPGARPADAPPEYNVGHFHTHPMLRPGRNPANFPVGPSAADSAFATGKDSPGIVRDYTTTARTTEKDYTYGPAQRTAAMQ